MNEINITVFIMNMLLPMVMIIFGLIFLKKAPKTINNYYGYRTIKSKRNIDTWNFAHHYFGNIWFKLGVLSMLVSFIVMILLYNKADNIVAFYSVILTFIHLVFMVTPIYFTEKKLGQTFDKEGKCR